MSGLQIRRARLDDGDAVAAMVVALARDIGASTVPRVSGADLRRHTAGDSPLLTVFVAEVDGELSGAVLASVIYSTWRGALGFYVVDLYVDPVRRGQGIGEALMDHLAGEAEKRGLAFLKLEVDETNTGAIRFYRRLGFEPVKEDRNWVLTGPALIRRAGMKSPCG